MESATRNIVDAATNSTNPLGRRAPRLTVKVCVRASPGFGKSGVAPPDSSLAMLLCHQRKKTAGGNGGGVTYGRNARRSSLENFDALPSRTYQSLLLPLPSPPRLFFIVVFLASISIHFHLSARWLHPP